ncbi:ribosomal protein [Dioszegia hungarica]|uniref:Ribosomal protein n=1 Tax=Dioszegia hungarica TaxID=4972 RepID=A0AA38LYI4_9TREE|nr:ribosomal protein [Dioszegia hungarica]KAI9639868.1 ribosomal protein [Dioszegia hungarica]
MPRFIPRLSALTLPTRLIPTTLPTLLARPSLLTLPSSSVSATPRLFSQSSSPFFPRARLALSSAPSLLSLLSLSARPSLSASPVQTQIRTLAYGTTYQPSQRKRKRKYGFLARLKGGRLGKAVLSRRRIQGRRFLSH